MNPLVLVEIPAGETKLGMLGPHARANGGVGDTGLFDEFALNRFDMKFAGFEATARELKPCGLGSIRWITRRDQQNPLLGVEAHDSCGHPTQDKTHGAETYTNEFPLGVVAFGTYAGPMRWTQRDLAGSAAALHACEPSAERSITWMIPDEPTWCIGNAQLRGGEWGPAALPADVLDTQGVPCIRRRSGGGAVLVAPNTSLWCDVSIGRFDPLWKADVERSFDWLGELCRRALRTAAPDLPWDCHHGPPLERQAGAALCFAGVGHGELMSGERKAVGLAQIRTADRVRFQCLVYSEFDVEAHVQMAQELYRVRALSSEVLHRCEARLENHVAVVPDLGAFQAALWEEFARFTG